MEINKELLGKRIKDIRVNTCKAKLQQFAELIDSGKSNVSRWERGENIPNDLTLTKIAELGNMTVDELLGNDENVTISNSEYKYLKEIEEKYNAIKTLVTD